MPTLAITFPGRELSPLDLREAELVLGRLEQRTPGLPPILSVVSGVAYKLGLRTPRLVVLRGDVGRGWAPWY